MRASAPILEMKGISKYFPGVQALDRVDFTLFPGEVHALMGENGAGKSTLMNVLNGLVAADAGDIFLSGHKEMIRTTKEAEQLGVAFIHQEMNLIPVLSVAENICLGNYPRTGALRRIDRRAMRREAAEVLTHIDLDVDPRTPVEALGLAQQQLVEITRALRQEARIVVMDEPTSALTTKEIEILYRIVNELRNGGTSIVFISHKLEEVEEVADRVTVLRNGKLIGSLARDGMSRSRIVEMMIGRELAAQGDIAHGEPPAGNTSLLSIRGLTSHPDFFEVTFDLKPGEILGIAGLVGSGRSEVLEAITGARPAAGTIQVEGKTAHLRSPEDALKAGIAYLPEDRRAKGLFMRMDLGRNLTVSRLRDFVQRGLLRPQKEKAYAADLSERFGVRAPGLDQVIRNLSGGNQQKVVMARCVDTGARVILLNEPTRGIDVGAKADIYRLMDDLRATGRGIVVVSSELPELLRVSDRILVMAAGRVTGVFSRAEATQDRVVRAMFGERLTG